MRILGIVPEQAEAVDVGGAERGRLADRRGARVGIADLEADGEVAGEQAEAERDAVGVQAVAHQVVEIHAVQQFLDGLLDPPAPTVSGGQATGPPGAQAGDLHPRAAPVGG